MTEEQLKKTPFHFVSHINMEDVHISTYASKDGKLGFSDFTDYRKNCRTKREFRIEDKTYPTYKKFIEALKDYGQ